MAHDTHPEPKHVSREDLSGEITAFVAAVRDALRERPELRPVVRSLADLLAAIGREGEEDGESREAAQPMGQAREVEPPSPPLAEAPLKIGDIETTVLVRGTEADLRAARESAAPPAAPEQAGVSAGAAQRRIDLSVVVQRARLKGEACRWAVERRRRLAEEIDFDTAIKPTDKTLIDRARALPDCLLWMLDPYASLPDDGGLLVLAECYDNLAVCVEIAAEAERNTDAAEDTDDLENALLLLAEAQSALRRGIVEDAGLGRGDRDQDDVFFWLREQTLSRRIFVPRHMRLDDPADPRAWESVRERAEALRESWESRRRAERERERLIRQVRFHVERLRGGDPDTGHHWDRILSAVSGLVEGGMRPSDRYLRELLLPVIDEIPDGVDADANALLVLREIDHWVAQREAEPAPERPQRQPTEDVLRVAELLRGSRVVLIGGERRRQAQEALEREFDLAELRWIDTTPHQSPTTFEAEVARPETRLVMLAIRWASHSFEGVKTMCERYGKPYVRLPGGYNPNQVAAQILAQAGDRLASAIPA